MGAEALGVLKRRMYGEHLTPIQIFKRFVLPEIKNQLYDYVWVDLFAGEGNLILPILELIPENKRADFFKKHIYLFDIQQELINRAIKNAESYGIPENIARNNIIQKDTLKEYPKFLLDLDLPIYHVTNPPYLYIGYIVKHKETWKYLEYFKNGNEGYQDLYQLGLINDLRNGIERMIYIIPSNFLFGFSVSNKIRDDFLEHYTIKKAVIFEKGIFEHTGTNVVICFFEKKGLPGREQFSFEGIKINREIQKKTYELKPRNHYRAGNDFEDFVDSFKADRPLKIKYYLTVEEVEDNRGDYAVNVIDANGFNGKEYQMIRVCINRELYDKVMSNILFVRTVDTGGFNGRAGLYKIRDVFGVDGILVTKAKYRTHPIQIFLEPQLTQEEQILLMNYFNLMLEYFRSKTDSEFMTTYKYSNSEYTRKYLGLSQVKKLIQTFPWLSITKAEQTELEKLVNSKNAEGVIFFLKERNKRRKLQLWL
ncbi:N-6 DNA methylase [Hippea sp. KM1]|uniref:N-6 DNA methylase n=1 Tax=Hippea sp. KM1 TaxID=944481 RepID=UPI0004B0818D|nr:N-6 DNA methylase [Hippea sp. KM1]